ncbi:hypothetical protein VZT92_018239 [Zoarces viviparus]|uniref:Uncharacterized protein n=1 Tax=Zoarces viviparus TaxID=48416 RepID=A0AAW1EN20_ZOAVI
MGERRSEGWGDGLRRPRPIERESGSDPRIWSGGDRRREAPSAATQTIPEKLAGAPGEFSFLCEGQGALEWVRPERGARALESVAVPAASGELSLALENPGEKV